MDNVVIWCLSDEQGKRIIEFFKSKDFDTRGVRGDTRSYYGVINGQFCMLSIKELKRYPKVSVIELPKEIILPKVGDRVLVGDKDDWEERIFLAYLGEEFMYPIITVTKGGETAFIDHKLVEKVSQWRHWKLISKEIIVELTLQDISEGKGVGVPVHLIRIKNNKT